MTVTIPRIALAFFAGFAVADGAVAEAVGLLVLLAVISVARPDAGSFLCRR